MTYQSDLYCSIKKQEGDWWENIFKTKDEKEKPEVEFKPGSSSYYFSYKNDMFWFNLSEGDPTTQGHDREIVIPATINIYVRGSNTKPIKALINDAVEHNMVDESEKVGIYELHRWCDQTWTMCMKKEHRPLESVVLDKKVSKDLIHDMKTF